MPNTHAGVCRPEPLSCGSNVLTHAPTPPPKKPLNPQTQRKLTEDEPAGAPDVTIDAVGMHYATSLTHKIQTSLQVGPGCGVLGDGSVSRGRRKHNTRMHHAGLKPTGSFGSHGPAFVVGTRLMRPAADFLERPAAQPPNSQLPSPQLESDTPEIVNECVKAVRKGGRVSVIAAYGGER